MDGHEPGVQETEGGGSICCGLPAGAAMTRSNATGTYYQAIPTLGYPTQKAAIIALYSAGHSPCDIKSMVNTSSNSVHRALTEWRKAQRKSSQ